MLHPSSVAVDYIWEKFETNFLDCSKDAVQLRKDIRSLMRAAAHRPFDPTGPSHRQFAKSQLGLISRLEEKFAWLDFRQERSTFGSVLNNQSPPNI